MGAYPARRPECLEADARTHPAGSIAIGPRNHVALLVGIDGRPRIAPQDALRPPRGEGSTRPTVALVLGITGLVVREVQANDVPRVAREEAPVLFRADHVVRRRDDSREVIDQLAGVAQRAERADRRH